MRSSHVVLFCFAAYLCYDGVASQRHFSQEDEKYLNDGNSWRTEKNAFARKLRDPTNMGMKFKNDLDNIVHREDSGKNIIFVSELIFVK